MATFVTACKRYITMVAKFQDLKLWSLLTVMAICIVEQWRKVWATVLFPSAIMRWKVILYMSVFLFLLPYLQNQGLLRSRNFATMATCSNFSFLQGSHAPWKSLKIAVSAGLKSLNFGAYFIQPILSRKKDLQDKTAHVVEELKNIWMESLKNGKCVLESCWKVLEFFCSKKGTKPVSNNNYFYANRV